jgi:hypothetical protein
MGRISRGWALTKQSWGVLKSDRSLVIFPMLSTICALIAIAVIWLPTASMSGVLAADAINEHAPVYDIAAAATVIVVSIISSALSEIFRVAVYQYAVTGAPPGAFDDALLQNAFNRRTHLR